MTGDFDPENLTFRQIGPGRRPNPAPLVDAHLIPRIFPKGDVIGRPRLQVALKSWREFEAAGRERPAGRRQSRRPSDPVRVRASVACSREAPAREGTVSR